MATNGNRCAVHADRGASGFCPSCQRSFCRECLTEHEGRVTCVHCLKELLSGEAEKPGSRILPWVLEWGGVALGLGVAWLFFFVFGKAVHGMAIEFFGP